MEWSDDYVLLLIEEYRSRRCLWDPRDPQFKMLHRKVDAWQEISNVLVISAEDAKKKMVSLLASFRRERSKECTSSGMGAGAAYHSKWFAFKAMAFLLDKFEVRKSRCTEEANKPISVEAEESIIEEEEEEDECCLLEILEDGEDTRNNEVILAAKNVTGEKRPPPEQQKPPQKKRRVSKSEAGINSALEVIKSVSNNIAKVAETEMSACDSFGGFVAAKLKSYSLNTQNMVQCKMSEVLFQADIGAFD